MNPEHFYAPQGTRELQIDHDPRFIPVLPIEMIVTDRGKDAITASEGERSLRALNSASFTSAYRLFVFT
jgi:hypothetical protein